VAGFADGVSWHSMKLFISIYNPDDDDDLMLVLWRISCEHHYLEADRHHGLTSCFDPL
jgi:hypothetical protein